MSAAAPSGDSTPPVADGPGGDAAGAVQAAADASHAAEDAGLELANLLASGQGGALAVAGDAGAADAHAYDGHVALELDPGLLPDIDSALDLLTSSHQLFDVPALDVASVLDDSLPT